MKKYLLLLFVPAFFMLFVECAKEKQAPVSQASDTLNVEYENLTGKINCFSASLTKLHLYPGPCFAVTNEEDYQKGFDTTTTRGPIIIKGTPCFQNPPIDFSKYSLASVNFHGGGSTPKVTFKIVKVISQRKIIVITNTVEYDFFANLWYEGYWFKIPNPEGFAIEFILNRTHVPDPNGPHH